MLLSIILTFILFAISLTISAIAIRHNDYYTGQIFWAIGIFSGITIIVLCAFFARKMSKDL